MPRLGTLLWHAAPRVLESMILPVALFYAGLLLAGEVVGGVVSAVWVFGGLAWRLVRGRQAPGLVLLATAAMTARVVLLVITHSSFFFFLQPTLGVLCVSLVFLWTARGPRPMAQRVAADLVPLPDRLVDDPLMARFFRRQSLVWGFAQLGNFTLSIWLLVSQSIETFLIVRTSAVGLLLSATAVVSLVDFRRCLGALQPRA
ncbi:hypothetical protein OIE66_41190 [Nonomuraea sp. NBC_01738]|uniref:VC0807 family protein n=1 Tax=Nonomuraea sp. NBC_01738 TaxID=2976003 RepID=UPI002E0EFBB9|nr:hypothetical protein OIE66_41190 [Nonomuraea sp. NBC_01738]